MIYVALLRGINVGGNSQVKMADLKACFEKLGFIEVKTYINSGNIIFKTNPVDARKLEGLIEPSLYETFGNAIKVVVRNINEMKTLVEDIPNGWLNSTNKKCNVIFLRRSIDSPSILNGLNPKIGIEELTYKPGVLYWAANTSDLTKSAMVKLSQNAVYKEMTVRNLNTTLKVYELMQSTDNS